MKCPNCHKEWLWSWEWDCFASDGDEQARIVAAEVDLGDGKVAEVGFDLCTCGTCIQFRTGELDERNSVWLNPEWVTTDLEKPQNCYTDSVGRSHSP
jgi:hypothetical protein